MSKMVKMSLNLVTFKLHKYNYQMKNSILFSTLFASLLSLNAFAQQTNKNKESLGKNIVSFTPIQMMVTDDNESPDPTIGLSYERILDNEIISLRIPFYASLQKPYYYILPTIKLYPGRQGAAKYAVGPQFLIGFGEDSYTKYMATSTGYYYQTVNYQRKQFGFLINNSLNITVAKNFYLGLDGGIGVIYSDNSPYYSTNGIGLSPLGDSDIKAAFQLNCNFGVRF